MKDDQDTLNVLRTLRNKPRFSQRDLAKSLGFSLGKLNYVLRSLQEKGLVKIRNFQNQKNKIDYIQYVLTAKGINIRYKLTVNFMKKKMKEYEELKKDIEKE